MLASVDSFATQRVFFSTEFGKQMTRRQEFFGPTVESQFGQLSMIPANLLCSAEARTVLAASSSNPPVDPDPISLVGASYYIELLVTFFYFEAVSSVSVVFETTGIVITYVPASLYVTVTKPVDLANGTTVFKRQKYFVDTTLAPTAPFGSFTIVDDVRDSDPEVKTAMTPMRLLGAKFGGFVGPADSLSKWGKLACPNASWSGNLSVGNYVPIMRYVSVVGVSPFLIRAEYPMGYLNSAWSRPHGSEPRQLLVDEHCNIVATNVPSWAAFGVATCLDIPAVEIGRALKSFVSTCAAEHGTTSVVVDTIPENVTISGSTKDYYYTIQLLSEASVLNGTWFLLEASETPTAPWSDTRSLNGQFVGTMFGCMLISGLIYYLFSRAVFSSLVDLAAVLETTASRYQRGATLTSSPEAGDLAEDEDGQLQVKEADRDPQQQTRAGCCQALMPDFWGAHAAHLRIVQHIEEVMSFVPQKSLRRSSTTQLIEDLAQAPSEQIPHAEQRGWDDALRTIRAAPSPQSSILPSFDVVASDAAGLAHGGGVGALATDQPIELMQRNRNVPNDEIGQLLRCRMTAVHCQVINADKFEWHQMHVILRMIVRQIMEHGGIVESVEFGSVTGTFNCHAPVSEHEQFAIRAAHAAVRHVASRYPDVALVAVADSDVAASVALGNAAVRVQSVLGPSIEIARKLSQLQLTDQNRSHVVATGSVVTNIRFKSIILDCVRPKYGLIHLSDPMRPVYHTNGGKVVHLVTDALKCEDSFGSNAFKLNCAFQDMLEGQYSAAIATLMSIRDDPELSPHVERFIVLCHSPLLQGSTKSPARYVRHEVIPWQAWPSEKEFRSSVSNTSCPQLPSLLPAGLAIPDDGLSGRPGSTSCRSSHASDPPLICSLSHLDDSMYDVNIS